MANQTTQVSNRNGDVADRVASSIRESGVSVNDLCTIADALGEPVESFLIGDTE